MLAFWLSGAALTVAVLALVLRPLVYQRTGRQASHAAANLSIYRQQLRELDADLAAGKLARADYDRARLELEASLLEDLRAAEAPGARRIAGPGLAIFVGAGVPVLAVALYLWLGNPAAIEREPEHAQIDAMVARLAARLRENPEDAAGWQLLGRSYGVLGRFGEAAQAYASATLRAPADAQLLADYADALAMARGRRLEGEPEKLIRRALEIDPANLKALALAGSAAFERKDYAAAVAYWQRMLPHAAPGSEDARAIEQNIGEAQMLGGQSYGSGLRGTVSIAPRLEAKAAPDDTVFIFARAAEGPRMPLAVARARVRDLPYRFLLDDSMAMTPAMKLSAFPRVIVGARVSKTGTATPQEGDLQGVSAPAASDATGITVVIDSEVR